MKSLYAKYGSGFPVEDFGFVFGVVLMIWKLPRALEIMGWLS